MRRLLLIAALALATGAVLAPVAQAGSPHFINSAFSVVRSGDTVTVSGKEAGLGDETQIEVLVTADAACVNPGIEAPEGGEQAVVLDPGDGSRFRTARPTSASR